MGKTQETRFSEQVAKQLTSEEIRTLWTPVAHELDRVDGGPEAAKEYLDAEFQRLVKRVESSLDSVKKD